MKMQDIRSINYAPPPDIKGTEESKTKQMNSLKYVDHLATCTQTDVTEWPIDLFFNSEGKVWLERQKINEIFFDFKSKADTLVTAPKISLLAIQNFEDKFKAMFTKLRAVAIKDLEVQKKRLLERAADLSYAQREVIDATLKVSVFEKAEIKIKSQVEKILADGFWTLDETSRHLEFVSTPINLAFFDEASRRSNMANLGRLTLRIRFAEFGLEGCVFKHSGAEHNLENPHPHVGSGGNICYGNLSQAAHEALAKLNLVEYCSIMKSHLTSYNEGDAYVNIYDFVHDNSFYNDDDDPDDDDPDGDDPDDSESDPF